MSHKIKNVLAGGISIVSLLFLFAPYLSEANLVGNTNNATLSLSPNIGAYRVGATYQIDILLNTHGQNVVVAAAYINYNPSLFRVVSIDTANSIFTTEAEKDIGASSGIIKITRGIPAQSAVNVTNGKVATLNIQGLTDATPSSDNFNFNFTAGSTGDSNIILNDGLGTDILSGVDNAKFTLDGTPPTNVSGFTATPSNGSILLSWTNPATDFSGVTVLRKTGSFPTSPTDGTVVYNNAGTNYSDTGLANGVVYYYKIFSRDVVINYSSGVQISATPHDTTPPAQVTNLTATPLTARTIRLNWTAVGDNGSSGTAASYDLRYSASAITASNFTSASQASGMSTPKASGNAETITIAGLSGATTYYFAIKTTDASDNTSVISNIASAKTYKTSDLNSDNLVNSVDFGILMSYWGNTTKPTADINQDSAVNSVDFGIMMSQWGS